MTKEELKTKYARVPTDFSEIEMLKDQLLDSGLLEAAQVSPEDAGKVLGVKEDGTIGVVEGGGDVYLDGNSLVIPEQEGPQPIITIDGVGYFHKQEFDLEEITVGHYNLITGEQFPSQQYDVSYLFCMVTSSKTVRFCPHPSGSMQYSSILWPAEGATFASKAFTVVDTQEEVTNNTKICLPTCSAYYGFLSEDGKTFISYYNLKSDGAAPEYVDSIKQGNAIIPLKDSRVPNSAIADAGKVVKVGEDGSYELGEAGGSETPTVLDFAEGATMQDLFNAIGYDGTNQVTLYCTINAHIPWPATIGTGTLTVRFIGYNSVDFTIGATSSGWLQFQGNASNSTLIADFFADNSQNSNKHLSVYMPTSGSSGEPKPGALAIYGSSGWVVFNLPSDASSKIYTLKAVNGTLTWVE